MASEEPDTEPPDWSQLDWTASPRAPGGTFPYLLETTGEMPDPRKIAAREQLRARCVGFDFAKFLAQLDLSQRQAAMSPLFQKHSPARLAAAHSIVDASVDRFALSHAGHILLEYDELPIREIFGGESPRGKADLVPLWWQASSLATCASQLGCGPDSLSTLGFCAQHGCEPGVTYQQALAAALSPRDYQAVTGFSTWIGNRPD